MLQLATLALLFAPTSLQSQIYKWTSDVPTEVFGRVSRAGDVDLDGCEDVIVGSPGEDEARIFSGQSGLLLHKLVAPEFTPFSIGFGVSVADVGDVNGDGWPDVAVGAWTDDQGGSASGSTRVFSGRDGTQILLLPGETGNDHMGWVVSGVGDVDLDGTLDVLAGGPGDNLVPGTYGAARVYSGVDGAEIHEIHGDPGDHDVGWSVCDLGDVDQDGYADFAVGRYSYGQDLGPGWVRVYSGQSGTIYRTFPQLDIIGGGYAADIANVGDTDGDSVPDLAIALPYYPNESGAVAAGLVRIVSPATGAQLMQLQGENDHDLMGYSVSGAGDVNGDGVADVLAGAPDEVFVTGGPSPRAVVFSGVDGEKLLTFPGEPGDAFGYSVADAGDVNGDGRPDVVIGAVQDSDVAYKAGSATVYSSSKLALTAPDHTLPYPGGGTLPLRLNAGPAHAGELYVLLGSLSGIAPTVPLGGVLLPLAPDPYLAFTANHPGAAPLSGSIGTLPPSGVAFAQFTAPPSLPASYHGLTFHHAFVTLDLAAGAIEFASNAVPVSLVPPSELH